MFFNNSSTFLLFLSPIRAFIIETLIYFNSPNKYVFDSTRFNYYLNLSKRLFSLKNWSFMSDGISRLILFTYVRIFCTSTFKSFVLFYYLYFYYEEFLDLLLLCLLLLEDFMLSMYSDIFFRNYC